LTRSVNAVYKGTRIPEGNTHPVGAGSPPRDHRWLYVNGDYVLVAIASGVIVNVLSGY
jgi:hypothetical protein